MTRTGLCLLLLLLLAAFSVSGFGQACTSPGRQHDPDPRLKTPFDNLLAARLHYPDDASPAVIAEAWYELNKAADEFARALTKVSGNTREGHHRCAVVALDAGMSGIPIYWCEFCGGWAAEWTGYEVYLLLNPKGPLAEDAWWYGRLGHSFECHDYEGSKEESADLVKIYTNFLRRFPHGTHSAEAKKLLLLFQTDLDSYTKP